MSKIKTSRILKTASKEACHIQGNPHKAMSRFLGRKLAVQEEWDYIFKVLKDKTDRQKYFKQKSCSSEIKEKVFPMQTKGKVHHH